MTKIHIANKWSLLHCCAMALPYNIQAKFPTCAFVYQNDYKGNCSFWNEMILFLGKASQKKNPPPRWGLSNFIFSSQFSSWRSASKNISFLNFLRPHPADRYWSSPYVEYKSQFPNTLKVYPCLHQREGSKIGKWSMKANIQYSVYHFHIISSRCKFT